MQNVARIVPWGDIVSEHCYSVERRLDLTLDYIVSVWLTVMHTYMLELS